MITILKFQELFKAVQISEGSEIRTAYNVASVITGIEVETYRKMPWIDFVKHQSTLEIPSIGDLPNEWVKSFTVNGEVFYVEQRATEWNGETFFNMSMLTKDKDAIIYNLHMILAQCCYKEKGEIIPLAEFERRSQLFQENLDIRIAYPIGFFFAQLLVILLGVTQNSSGVTKINKRKRRKMLKLLQKQISSTINTVGTL